MLLMLVLPCTAQGMMLWTWVQLALAPHPTQCLSLAVRAIRWAGVAVRRGPSQIEGL